MAAVPIVDFGAYINNQDSASRDQAAQQIDEAFRTTGFVYLTNHGVPKEEVEECFKWSQKFFALPLATKLQAPHPPGSTHHRGYSAPGMEKVSQHTYDTAELSKLRTIPDCKESFEAGNTLDASQPNIWLPEPLLPGFRAFTEAFFARCAELVGRVLDALSHALHVVSPTTTSGLAQTHSKQLFQLRLLHYPSLPAAQLQRNLRTRIAAHSDFGSLTLLFQDGVGGLEIEDPMQPGVFNPVKPVEDAVLVNVGDLLARWSNDRWRATVHRVGAPSSLLSEGNVSRGESTRQDIAGVGDMVPQRYSIPFFAAPDPDVVIEALPGCWSEEKPRLYESVTVKEYVQMRMAALYEGAGE